MNEPVMVDGVPSWSPRNKRTQRTERIVEVERMMTIDQTCELMALHRSTIKRAIGCGEIAPVLKIGRVTRIPQSALLRYMKLKVAV